MRIAIDIRKIGPTVNSSAVVLVNLLRQIAARDCDNDYDLLIDRRSAADIAAIATQLGLDTTTPRWRIVPLGPSNRFLWTLWTVQRYCRRVRPDVFHTEYIVPFLIPRSTAVVTHIHDVSFAALPGQIGWRDLWFLRLLIPRSLRRADVVVAVSDFTRDEIVRYYGTDPIKVHVVPNALDDAATKLADDAAIAAVRERYALPPTYLLSLGTMQPRKNIPFLLRAFATVAPRLPDVDLVLAGHRGHHFDAAIDAAIAADGTMARRIHMTGYVAAEDVPALYAGAHGFVFPSLYEGFGLPLLEAMAQNTPVIACDQPVFHEVAGEAAVFAPADDLAAFAEAIYTVSTNDDVRTRLTRAGLERVRAFSWSDSATRMIAVYAAVRPSQSHSKH